MEGNFRCMDAILDLSDPANPKEPEWPRVDFIIGNPPFLGDKLMRRELGDAYIDQLRTLYEGRIPGQSDLCCYWFEKARVHIEKSGCKRAGLLATQGIRGGANREVLKRIKAGGDIFWAESDRPWILDGANVHVSMVAFDDGTETTHSLDGKPVPRINANLTAAADLATARPLLGNRDICFLGDIKGAAFDIPDAEARRMLTEPNAAGVPNSNVVFPSINGLDVTRRNRSMWIIDFGVYPAMEDCVRYQEPFAYIDTHVRPVKSQNRREIRAKYWWRHSETHPEMRCRIAPLPRFLTTVAVAKHRLFVWMSLPTLPDHAVFIFARSDDLFFGVLHSRFHEVWALRMGTRLETRPRYTPTTCFETFPFPPGVIPEPRTLNSGSPLAAIAAAAKELNELRENWLNPPEWTRTETLEFPGTVGGPWDRYIDPASLGQSPATPRHSPATVTDWGAFKVGTVRYPRLVARDAECAARLKDRTLTKLYNARPAWLATCHAKLDAAVAAAYGWPADLTDDAILERLLALNQAQVLAL